jgi:hypothetical protein
MHTQLPNSAASSLMSVERRPGGPRTSKSSPPRRAAYTSAVWFGIVASTLIGCSSSTEPVSEPLDTSTTPQDSLASDVMIGDGASPTVEPAATTWRVEVAAAAPRGVAWAADDVVLAFSTMGQTVSRAVLTAEPCAAGLGVIRFEEPAASPGGAGDAVLSTDQTWSIREERCGSGRLITLAGGGLLGRQYAAYDLLHRVGARFFHPEQEWYPAAPTWPDAAMDLERTPAIRWRSASLHLTHPLELGDAFRLGKPEYELEAKRYIDWQLKNLASYGEDGIGAGEYARYGLERGLMRSTGLGLYGQQQGASGLIDPDSPKTAEEQLADAIEARFAAPDTDKYPIRLFSVGFQPTEFTTEPEDEVVAHLRFIADYIVEHHPDVMLLATFHATKKPLSEKYGVSPYALMVPAHERYGVNIHTLMFYDLERPAPVYGNTDFNYLADFMRQYAGTRRLWYFPESAWWLTFDLPVPLYLPITIEARSRDLAALRDLVDSTWQDGQAAAGDHGLDGHRVFGSGHEWGYWQNEYCSYRMAADLDYDWKDCIADITSPMGPAAATVASTLQALVAHQQTVFFDAELLRYLVGTDKETEAAAAVGVVFHPLPPKPEEILAWTDAELTTWETVTAPKLLEMASTYAGFVSTLAPLEASVPASAAPFFREIRDGIEATGLRARHGAEVYGALAARRHAQLRGGDDASAAMLAAAKATTAAALTVIHRREADYRYLPIERSIGGGESLDGDENWTIYPYRYLARTHWAFYWTQANARVTEALAGAGAGEVLQVTDALAKVGDAHALTLLAASPGGEVDWADGTVEPALPGAASLAHTYAAAGRYLATVTLGGIDHPVALGSLVTETATGKTGSAVSPAGVAIIDPLLPALVFGSLGPAAPGTPERLAVGFSVDGVTVAPSRWVALDVVAAEEGITTAPADLTVPIVNGKQLLAEIGLIGAVFELQSGGVPTVSGALATDELVGAVVGVGGFEEDGARALVASLLGLTPDTLPDSLAFQVMWGK